MGGELHQVSQAIGNLQGSVEAVHEGLGQLETMIKDQGKAVTACIEKHEGKDDERHEAILNKHDAILKLIAANKEAAENRLTSLETTRTKARAIIGLLCATCVFLGADRLLAWIEK